MKSKLYWELRKAMSYKSMKMGSIVTSFRPHKYAPIKMRTYPCNRWGAGYWRNRPRRSVLD